MESLSSYAHSSSFNALDGSLTLDDPMIYQEYLVDFKKNKKINDIIDIEFKKFDEKARGLTKRIDADIWIKIPLENISATSLNGFFVYQWPVSTIEAHFVALKKNETALEVLSSSVNGLNEENQGSTLNDSSYIFPFDMEPNSKGFMFIKTYSIFQNIHNISIIQNPSNMFRASAANISIINAYFALMLILLGYIFMQSLFSRTGKFNLKIFCLVSICLLTIPGILGFAEFVSKFLFSLPPTENIILLGMNLSSLFLSVLVGNSLNIFHFSDLKKYWVELQNINTVKKNLKTILIRAIYLGLTFGSIFLLVFSISSDIYARSLVTTRFLILTFLANFLVLIFYRRPTNEESTRKGLIKVWSIVMVSGIIFASSALNIIDLGLSSSRFMLITGLVFSILLVYFEVYLKELKASLELREKEKQKWMLDSISRTSQMVVHDVMRPFTALKMTLNMIEAKGNYQGIDPRFLKMIKQVDAMAVSVKRMLDDLLFLGSKGRVQLVDLNLHNILMRAKNISLNNDVDFQTSFCHQQNLRGDALQLERVFQNLFANAVKAMQGHGKINVQTSDISEEGKVEIIVGNDGPPIDLSGVYKS